MNGLTTDISGSQSDSTDSGSHQWDSTDSGSQWNNFGESGDNFVIDDDDAEMLRCENKAAEAASGWMGLLASDMTWEDKAYLKNAGAKNVLSDSLDSCIEGISSSLSPTSVAGDTQAQRDRCKEVARKETALALGVNEEDFSELDFKQLQRDEARDAASEIGKECMEHIMTGYKSGA